MNNSLNKTMDIFIGLTSLKSYVIIEKLLYIYMIHKPFIINKTINIISQKVNVPLGTLILGS